MSANCFKSPPSRPLSDLVRYVADVRCIFYFMHLCIADVSLPRAFDGLQFLAAGPPNLSSVDRRSLALILQCRIGGSRRANCQYDCLTIERELIELGGWQAELTRAFTPLGVALALHSLERRAIQSIGRNPPDRSRGAYLSERSSISKLVEHTRWQRTQRLCFTPNNKHCPTLSNTVQHMSNTTLSNTVQHKQHCPTQTTITPTNTDHHSHQYTTHKQNTSLTQPTHSQHHFTCI